MVPPIETQGFALEATERRAAVHAPREAERARLWNEQRQLTLAANASSPELAVAKAQYEARIVRSEDGRALATVALADLNAHRATAASATAAAGRGAGLTEAEASLCAEWDAGVRRGMHASLAKERAQFEQRAVDDNGRVLATVPESRLAGVTTESSARTERYFTDAELRERNQWDGGGRLGMHADLSKQHEAYAARPTDESGVTLATVPESRFADGVRLSAVEPYKSDSERALEFFADGGGQRKGIHSGLMHARAQFEMRPVDDNGRVLTTVPESRLAGIATESSARTDVYKTTAEQVRAFESDVGRKSMHASLAQQHNAYVARPTDKVTGVTLTTVPQGSAPESRLASTPAAASANILAHKTSAEQVKAFESDVGRKLMHADLTRHSELYAMRPQGANGSLLATVPNGPSFEHTARQAALREAPVPAWELAHASVGSGIHETGMTQRELEEKRIWDGGNRRGMHGDLTKVT
jgi:hypothetical protein